MCAMPGLPQSLRRHAIIQARGFVPPTMRVGAMLAPSFTTGNQETGRATQPLLPLKLTPPPPREGVLLRPDLQALLPEIRVHPLTLVVAPAGYGKTTLLSQWVQDL